MALASVLGWGVCPEAMWPFQATMVNEMPTAACYQAAEALRAVQFAELQHGDPVKDALASGLPVVFGMAVPPSFPACTGRLEAPANGEWEAAGGGHAMLIVGYDDLKNAFLVRNSWGTGWGIDGHVWIDYNAMMHYASTPVYRGEKPFVIGDIAEVPAFRTVGATGEDLMRAVANAVGPALRSEILATRQSVSSELEDHLSQARNSIRDRLRGPGAGGGYGR